MEKLKNTLEIASNIAVLLVAVAVLSVLAITLFFKPATPNLLPGLKKGERLGAVAKVDYRNSEQTLLIALNTNCSYCVESLPLYRKLTEAQGQASKSLQIVALFPNSSDDVAKFVKENQLAFETVAGVDLASLRVSGTPTMILVDNQGEVKNFWLGRLAGPEAEEFFRSLIAENRRLQ